MRKCWRSTWIGTKEQLQDIVNPVQRCIWARTMRTRKVIGHQGETIHSITQALKIFRPKIIYFNLLWLRGAYYIDQLEMLLRIFSWTCRMKFMSKILYELQCLGSTSRQISEVMPKREGPWIQSLHEREKLSKNCKLSEILNTDVMPMNIKLKKRINESSQHLHEKATIRG